MRKNNLNLQIRVDAETMEQLELLVSSCKTKTSKSKILRDMIKERYYEVSSYAL